MYSSRELIDALLARGRRGLSLRERNAERPPGEFPPGWRAWFASMHARVGAVTGATAEAIVAIFLARELAKPAPRSAELGRWQAFTALWRQQWHESGREPAYERVIALVVTLLAHLLLAILLLWIAWVRFMGQPAPAGEDVVQVEYIGEGTPEETGGGAPAAEIVIEEPEAPADAAPPPPAAATAPSAVAEEPAPQPPEAPTPQPPAETPAPQPLQVTETPTPDSTFVLPPTTAPELELAVPEVRRPAVQTIQREVELVETPTPPAIRPQLIERPVQPVEVPPRETRVQTRTVPLLTPPQDVPRVAQQPQPAPEIQAPARQLQAREIPLSPAQGEQAAPRSSPAGQAPASTASRPGTATSSPSTTAPASGRPADSSGDRPATAAGRGASPNAAPGAFPTPSRGDDWGESDRNVPGGNAGTDSGLFDADGRPRLPPGTAAPGGGFPPGSDDWTREQLDRHGTWATRPPLGYEPTRFDQYWIPSGTLLDEWVRRGIKNMSIPIPGTSKKISCVISILQLGGGCGITDPNLQDQEAIARPPPDIPYKPELQEPEQ